MDSLKSLSKRVYLRKDSCKNNISKKLNFEIKQTQKMLSDLYKKRYKRKKAFTRIQASDFIAETFRNQRYKMKK